MAETEAEAEIDMRNESDNDPEVLLTDLPDDRLVRIEGTTDIDKWTGHVQMS